MDGNVLYYGDNLDVLRRHIPDETHYEAVARWRGLDAAGLEPVSSEP